MSQPLNTSPNAGQIEYWNSVGGETWVRFQQQLDRQIEPLGLEAMRVLAPTTGEDFLDIGCGCGQTSWALAERVGREGSVLGIDISEPMLAVARSRSIVGAASQPRFSLIDAQAGDLRSSVFDAAFSRFGVMFFDDPLAAFTNIRKSLKPKGRLVFVCWRPMLENEWMRVPFEAARALLPPTAPTDPMAPGPYALADLRRLQYLLPDAGFPTVSVVPYDTKIGGSNLEQATELSLKVGPLGAALREYPNLRSEVTATVSDALSKHMTPQGILLGASVWIVHAQNG